MAKSRRPAASSRKKPADSTPPSEAPARAKTKRRARGRTTEEDVERVAEPEAERAAGVDDAWHEPCRPLASLLFVAPILLAYEAGVLALGHDQVRGGADVWLRASLDWLGFGQYFLLPLLVCSILLAWHHVSREPWTLGTGVFPRMFVETSVFALVLLFLAQAQSQMFTATRVDINSPDAERMVVATTLLATRTPDSAAGLVGYLGAGLYEELLFRLMLLPFVAGVLRTCGARPTASVFVAIVASSLLFAAAHYRFDVPLGAWRLVTHGEAFDGFSFAFRWLAGALFGVLFVYRGFGITVGTHALYDVLAVVF